MRQVNEDESRGQRLNRLLRTERSDQASPLVTGDDGQLPEAVRHELRRIMHRLDEIGWAVEKWNVAEFHEYFRKPRRVLLVNFAAGITRGIGMAIGFTLLGAFVIWFLKALLVANLPGLGRFVAELIRIINSELRVRP